MSLTFGKLGVANKTYYVQKTGFPFYDACQLVGAMHLFFGTGVSSLNDKKVYWELSGPNTGKNTSNYGERLKGRGLERIDQTTLVYLDKLEALVQGVTEYYEALPPKTAMMSKSNYTGVSRYLEPAWLTGAKGKDAALYGVLASQRGVSSERPEPEILTATLGLTQVALAYGNDEITTILPVLENTLQPLQPFLMHKQRYQHSAGGAISTIFASLGILVDLGQKYRITDFAFAYHGGRGFYYSGLLGLYRLCSQFSEVREFARQALTYFENSRGTDPGTPMDLARLLAEYLKNPSLNTLAAIVRTKSRVLANGDLKPWIRIASVELLSTKKAIEEAINMAENQKRIPPPSEALVKAVGEVFRAEDQGTWIGAYINLERAHKPDEFYAEVSKILSRALSRSAGDKKWLFAKLRDAMSLLTTQEVIEACEPANLRYFPAHKTAFLLRILGSMKYQANEQPQTTSEDLTEENTK